MQSPVTGGWQMPSHISEGKMFHVKAPTPKHIENSYRGDLKAKAQGCDSNDVDMLKTLDGIIINEHWPRLMVLDGFIDPLGKLNPHTTLVSNQTWATLQRLHTQDGHRLRTMAEAFMHLAEVGLIASAEAKGPNWSYNDMESLWRAAHTAKCPTIIKSAWTHPLTMAKQVGFQVRYTVDHKPGM